MELYKNDLKYPQSEDCEPTIKFIHRMNDLIRAMTSRSMDNKLSLEDPNKSKEVMNICLNYYEQRFKQVIQMDKNV